MATPLIYDALLVHYLARELDDRLRGRRLRGVRFDSDARRVVLEMDDERLVWELHAARGWMRVVRDADAAGAAAVEGWGGRKIRTQRRPRVRGVSAPADERILTIEIDAGGPDRAARFVVELMTNQWNVLALDPAGRIVSALWTRETGGRTLRSGVIYEAPAGLEHREGLVEPVSLERFRQLIALSAGNGSDKDSDDRSGDGPRRALIQTLAWTSTLNADAILAGAADVTDPAAVYERYRAVAARPDPEPRLLELRGGLPYPLPLPGVPGRPASSLLDAFGMLAEAAAPAGLAPEVRATLEDRLDRADRKARALRGQAESAPEKAMALRARADILMARLHEVSKGAARVELADFEGGTVELELDPSRSPVENAEDLYDRARKRERAAERLPARVREAEAERDRLQSLLEDLDAGKGDPAEVAGWLDEIRPTDGGGGRAEEERLPYRAFRSSGGLEIRVGRSGRANDDLTFHHSAPNDVWLHARDVPGAHVVLRWGDRDQNPPRRDLMEAAILAAVNSKARTSATVPVDWTRRKYVRSPRNAPPGTVIPDRVSTLFVEPDPEVEERLK